MTVAGVMASSKAAQESATISVATQFTRLVARLSFVLSNALIETNRFEDVFIECGLRVSLTGNV